MMNEGVDDAYISGFLNHHARGRVKFFECDISKYDKSQNEFCLELECLFMQKIGVPAEEVEIWRKVHTGTRLVSKKWGSSIKVGV